MAVFRVEKTKDFTVMCNHHLRNVKLSLKAKGHFEHLWEQMHCSPSSATADSQALLLIIFLLLFHQSGITKELFPGRNSQFVVDILVVKL